VLFAKISGFLQKAGARAPLLQPFAEFASLSSPRPRTFAVRRASFMPV
jgi:hypothetical protein